jgi:hypothetical protein
MDFRNWAASCRAAFRPHNAKAALGCHSRCHQQSSQEGEWELGQKAIGQAPLLATAVTCAPSAAKRFVATNPMPLLPPGDQCRLGGK